MHFVQGAVRIRERQDLADQRATWSFEARRVREQAVLRVGRQRNSVARYKDEKPFDQGASLAACCGMRKWTRSRTTEKSLLDNRELAVAKPREQGAAATFGNVQQIAAGPEDAAGAAKIVAHETGRIFGVHLVLHGEVEDVVVAAGNLVQAHAYVEQEVTRRG